MFIFSKVGSANVVLNEQVKAMLYWCIYASPLFCKIVCRCHLGILIRLKIVKLELGEIRIVKLELELEIIPYNSIL